MLLSKTQCKSKSGNMAWWSCGAGLLAQLGDLTQAVEKRGGSLGCTSNLHISPKITIPSKKGKTPPQKNKPSNWWNSFGECTRWVCNEYVQYVCVCVWKAGRENICWRDDSKNLIKSHLSRWEKNPQLSGRLIQSIIRGEWPAVLTKHTWTHAARRRQKKERKRHERQ